MGIITELTTKYDTRNSFYGKAKVEDKGNNVFVLWSYKTLVAEVNDGHPVLYGKWSSTTTRHQKEFLKQYANVSEEEFKALQKEVL